MMRPIKFRAWDKKQRIMRQDFSIDAANGRMWETGRDPTQIVTQWTTERFALMQFTGLLDKNGKEIYEGDVVQTFRDEKHKGVICQIKYIGRSFCMAMDDGDTELDCIWYYKCEILGNIHENPELIRQGG